MSTILGSDIVDWSLLGQAALDSVLFGLGVLVVAGIACLASLKAQDSRAAGHESAVIGFSAITVVCVVGIAAAIAGGIWVMTQ